MYCQHVLPASLTEPTIPKRFFRPFNLDTSKTLDRRAAPSHPAWQPVEGASMSRDLPSNESPGDLDPQQRSIRRSIAIAGFLALLGAHAFLAATPATEDLIRGIPDELAQRVAWMACAWVYLLWLSAGLWNDRSTDPVGAEE